MSDEGDLFAKAMGQVTPVSGKSRVQADLRTKKKHQLLRSLEDRETEQQHQIKKSHLSAKRIEEWLLRADGVSSKDIKKLAQAHINHELDLHGHTQDEAIKALEQFVNKAIAEHARQICIVHGQGHHSGGNPVLKQTTYHWLEHGPFNHLILAAIPSLQSKGGACHVLLRKQHG